MNIVNGLNRRIIPKNKAIHVFVILFYFFQIGCTDDETKSIECITNLDCNIEEVCIEGICDVQKEQCETIGSFIDTIDIVPLYVSEIETFNVQIDKTGRTHYCYSGVGLNGFTTVYGIQINSKIFEEYVINGDGELITCNGILVSEKKTPYILSLNSPKILFLNKNVWIKYELEGIDDEEILSAFRSDTATVQMIEISDDIFIAISAGATFYNQSLFLYKVSNNKSELIFNSQEEDEDSIVRYGHGPQYMEKDGKPYLVYSRLDAGKIPVVNLNGNVNQLIDGYFPKLVSAFNNDNGIMYLNKNAELVLSEFESDETDNIEIIDIVNPLNIVDKHPPWDAYIGMEKDTKVIYKKKTSGGTMLMYKSVNGEDETSLEQIVSSELSEKIRGDQLFDVGIDSCGRTIIALLKDNSIKEEVNVLLKIFSET